MTSSRWLSAATAAIRGSAAGYRSSCTGRDWNRSRWRPGCRCTRGNSRRTIRLDLVQSMRPQVLEMGLATAAELDELDAAARAHLDDPRTVVMSGLLFLTWGRQPGRAA